MPGARDFDISMGGIFEVLTGINLPGEVVPDVVISERPTTSLPSDVGDEEVSAEIDLYVPEGWETVIIGGEERVVVPEVYRRIDDMIVLEPFDPNVDIGVVPSDEEFDEDEDDDMAHDWGHLIRQGIGSVTGVTDPGPANILSAPPGYTPPPGTGTVLMGDNGVPHHHHHRRRRRRLLTEGDFNDLMRIGTLPNKDTVKVALAKAIGRR